MKNCKPIQTSVDTYKSLNPVQMDKKSYKIEFRFNTFRNSSITGREGEIYVNTALSIEEMWEDKDQLEKLCFMEVQRLKPKWQVLSLNLTKISNDKRNNTNMSRV